MRHKLRIRFGAKEHIYSLLVCVKVRRSSPNRRVKILVLLLTKYMVMGI